MSDQPDPISWADSLLESYRVFWGPATIHFQHETGLSQDRVWQVFLVERFSSLIAAYRENAVATREYMSQVKPWMDEGLKHMREEHQDEDWKKPPEEDDPPV